MAALAAIAGVATILVAGVFSDQPLAMDGGIVTVVASLVTTFMDDEWKKHINRSMTAEVSPNYFYRRRRRISSISSRRPRR